MNSTLILIRHGESLWNAKNVWTGITDIGLSDVGKKEAVQAANDIASEPISIVYSSALSRAKQTATIILEQLGKSSLPIIQTSALNERDYGIYTGKNKLEVKQLLGESGYLALRRGWNTPVPEGENLLQVYNRVVPYFESEIAPHLKTGESILIVAHGNSLRALMKYIEHISDEDIASVELKTGEIVIYTFSGIGTLISKKMHSQGQVLG